jgi:DNA-binding NarL/FixJ family response regulator
VDRRGRRAGGADPDPGGPHAPRAELQGPGALTPAERRVAELAGAGRSNREIAEELGVTRKTVEMHLSNAYTNLGIRSRTQLADRLDAA